MNTWFWAYRRACGINLTNNDDDYRLCLRFVPMLIAVGLHVDCSIDSPNGYEITAWLPFVEIRFTKNEIPF